MYTWPLRRFLVSDIFDGYARDETKGRRVNPVVKDVGYGYDPEEELCLEKVTPGISYQDSDFTLANDQHLAVKEILKWLYESPRYRKPFMRLSGNAGTGKTLCISYLIQNSAELFPRYMKLRPPAVCTFTWKAALVLQSRNVPACSIHSIFYEPNGEGKDGEVTFKRRTPEMIRESYSMIIVDESSMVNSEMRTDIEAIGLPVLYVGDSGQLPAISEDPEDEFFMERAELRLTEVRRQALDSPIIRLSIDIREGKYIPYGKYGDGVFKVTPDDISDNVLIKTDQLICGRNDTRQALNRKVRRLLGYDVRTLPNENERLIGLNNLPERQMFNGQTWTADANYSDFRLENSHKTVMAIRGDDGTKRIQQCWFPEDLQYKSFPQKGHAAKFMKENNIYLVDYGYALTCHKMQGSSAKRPVIFEERLGDKKFHKRWLYTAVTRAVEKVFIVSNG